MDKRVLAAVVGIAAVIVAAVVIVAALPPASPAAVSTPPAESTATSGPTTATPSPTVEPVTAGVYRDYADDAVESAEGRILLFFHAPWCPQCRSIESDIVADGVPDGVTIIKVDYDSRQDLRQQYGVTLQTTFVEVEPDGDALQSHVAYDEPRLAAVLAAML